MVWTKWPGRGETERAREELHATMALQHALDANWLSLQAECAETSILIDDAAHAQTLYERLLPHAGPPGRRQASPRRRHPGQRRARLHHLARAQQQLAQIA
ncbi:MAG: hypothetical protein ACRDPA_25260 [Solirubrobacteraceae bacterium]